MKAYQEIIREMREDRDLKQADIAEIIGISQQTYSRYENGKYDLPIHALLILADYYKVTADYLIGRKDCMYGVPGLDKKVTPDRTAREVLDDILSLDAAGRAYVLESIALQKNRKAEKMAP